MGNSAEVIPLFSEMKVQAERRQGGRSGRAQRMRAKFTVQITAPDITFQADENKLAGDVAKAIAMQIKANMLGGYQPDGRTPLPKVSSATSHRRLQRQEQAARMGEADPRWKSPGVRKIIKKNWDRRFRAPSLGYFPPIGRYGSNDWWGVESGMLAFSVKAVPQNGAWTIYFANPRGVIDRGGMSAAARVFSRIPIWTDRSMRNDLVQKALRDFQAQLFASRLKRIGQGIMDLRSDAQETAETVEGNSTGAIRGG